MGSPNPIPLILMPARERDRIVNSYALPAKRRLLPELGDVIERVQEAALGEGIEITSPRVKVSTAPKPPLTAESTKEFSPWLLGGAAAVVLVVAYLLFRRS